MRYETVEIGGAQCNAVPFDQRHPDRFVAAFCVQSLRAVPLTVQAAWTLVETSLGPAPCFPPEISSVTGDWIRGACEFGKYFLAVFRPWREQAIDSDDAWAELVCFLRFVANAGSREEFHASLAFLADHPLKYAPFKIVPDDGIAEEMDVPCSESEEEADPESDDKTAATGLRPFTMDSDSDDADEDAGKETAKGSQGAKRDGNDAQQAMRKDSKQSTRIKRGLDNTAPKGLTPFFIDPDSDDADEDAGKETTKDSQGAKSDKNDAGQAMPKVPKQRMRIKRSLEAVITSLGVRLPAAFASMQETMALIDAVLKLTNAPECCLTRLLHQAQWSRTMLVDSFVHLPRILQREVARRLHDSNMPFETDSHVFNRLYGVRVELDVLLNGSDPMDLGALHSIMDTEDQVCNQILAQHDNIVAVAAIYLQLTACTNAALEEKVFKIDYDRKVQW
jgi:hypothetical protein